MENYRAFSGPYRATRLWNEAIRTFRNGMPTSRHWKQFRAHESCFTASEAIDWLHSKLCQNPHFGPSVTKQQTVQLLQKFYKAGVFESVKENDKDEFKEGTNLYRLSNKSPFKNLRTPGRAPLAPLNNQTQCSSPQFRPPRDVIRPSSLKDKLVDPEEVKMLPPKKVTLEASQLAELWKSSVIERLELLTHFSAFGVPWLKHEEVSALWVLYNVTCIGPRGVVRPPDCDESPPKWVLYGMKALTNWPNYESPLMPNYKGSEIDVFKVITDYFCTSDEPLILYQLYDAFIAVFLYVERLQSPKKHDRSLYQSVEDLLTKMSVSSSFALHSTPREYENMPDYVTLPRRPRKSVSTPEVRSKLAAADLSSICFETAFASEIPETRIIPKSSVRIPKSDKENRGVKQEVFQNEFGNRLFSSVRSPMAQEEFVPLDPAKISSEGFKREKSRNFFRRSGRRKSGRSEKGEVLQEMCQNSSGGYVNLGALESSGDISRDYVNVGVVDQWANRDQEMGNWSGVGQYPSQQSLYYPGQREEGDYPTAAVPSTAPVKRKCGDWYSGTSLNEPNMLQDQQRDRLSIYSQTSRIEAPLNDQLRRLFVSTFSLDLTTDRHNDGSSLSNCSAYPSTSRQASKARIVPTDSVLQQNPVPVEPNVLRIDLYRLLTLLLPPSDRRKLHLLLRFMSKVATNHNLVLKENTANKDFMVSTFYRCILRTTSEPDYDEVLAQKIVLFLMDNVEAVMTVPPEVCSTVQKKISDYQNSQQNQIDELLVPISYCLQVSPHTYEVQKKSECNGALSMLLDQIVNDQKMVPKEKKKRLKQFREAHPTVYYEHFPNGEDAVFLSSKKAEKKTLGGLKAKLKTGRI